MKRLVVLLDTNSLLWPFTGSLRLEEEVHRWIEGADIVVPSSVLRELETLSARGVAGAKGALRLARRFRIILTDLEGDAALETLAGDLRAWVVTGDRELRTRLEARGTGVLFPKGERRLAPSWTPSSEAPSSDP